jgi:hypothetical protein
LTAKKNLFFVYYQHDFVRVHPESIQVSAILGTEDQMSYMLADEIIVLQNTPGEKIPNEPKTGEQCSLEASARLFLLGKPVTPDCDRKRPLYIPKHRRAA